MFPSLPATATRIGPDANPIPGPLDGPIHQDHSPGRDHLAVRLRQSLSHQSHLFNLVLLHPLQPLLLELRQFDLRLHLGVER